MKYFIFRMGNRLRKNARSKEIDDYCSQLEDILILDDGAYRQLLVQIEDHIKMLNEKYPRMMPLKIDVHDQCKYSNVICIFINSGLCNYYYTIEVKKITREIWTENDSCRFKGLTRKDCDVYKRNDIKEV